MGADRLQQNHAGCTGKVRREGKPGLEASIFPEGGDPGLNEENSHGGGRMDGSER